MSKTTTKAEEKYHKVLVFAPDSPHTKKFIEMIENKIDHRLVLQETGIGYNYAQNTTTLKNKSIFSIFQIIKALWANPFEYDVVHIHFINFTAFVVSLFAFKPIILTAWGSDVLIIPEKNLIYKTITKFILWRAKVITSNSSQAMRISINMLAPGKQVNKVHFGISRYCKRTPFNEKENIIYSPRNHADLYNIDKIITSFKQFYQKNPDWTLVISGKEDPINTPKLKKMAKNLPIQFLGWVTQKENATWLSKSKIVVSIPSSDALSVTLMEAIYSNCICFVSDLYPNKEVITEGMNGFISTDYNLYKQINIPHMEELNKRLSGQWGFQYNQTRFLNIYKKT